MVIPVLMGVSPATSGGPGPSIHTIKGPGASNISHRQSANKGKRVAPRFGLHCPAATGGPDLSRSSTAATIAIVPVVTDGSGSILNSGE